MRRAQQLAVGERYDAVVAAKAAGLSNRQIAKAAGRDERTIRRTLKGGGKIAARKPRTSRTDRSDGDVTAAKMPHPLTEIAAVAITEEQRAAAANP